MRPVALRCEHRQDVPCIDEAAPRAVGGFEGKDRVSSLPILKTCESEIQPRLGDCARDP